jgi:hypothetical protein
MGIEIIGFNTIGWEWDGTPIEGSIARYRCPRCGDEWWATEEPRWHTLLCQSEEE